MIKASFYPRSYDFKNEKSFHVSQKYLLGIEKNMPKEFLLLVIFPNTLRLFEKLGINNMQIICFSTAQQNLHETKNAYFQKIE